MNLHQIDAFQRLLGANQYGGSSARLLGHHVQAILGVNCVDVQRTGGLKHGRVAFLQAAITVMAGSCSARYASVSTTMPLMRRPWSCRTSTQPSKRSAIDNVSPA